MVIREFQKIQKNPGEQIGRNRGHAAWNIWEFLKGINRGKVNSKKTTAAGNLGMFPVNGEDLLCGHNSHTRSEALARHHGRSVSKFVDSHRKASVFFGHLQIR